MKQLTPISSEPSKLYSSSHLPDAEAIQEWIVNYLADLLEVELDEIEETVPFDSYGLDSSAAVGLTGDLEEWLERDLDPTLLYDYPTVKTLAENLAATIRLETPSTGKKAA